MKRFLWFVLMVASIANADYLGSRQIDDYLTVMETLHDSSGDGVAATGDVDLWVYEDDNNTQIVDLTMDAFDSITGLYEQKFQLTTGVGFEAGKTYTVLIQATADGASGTNTHTFQILAPVDVVTIETVDATDKIADAVLDETLTGTNHNGANTVGKRIRQIEHVSVLREEEQAQGGTSTTITLHDDASSVNGFYDNVQVVIVGGAGIGQSRHVHAYVGSSRIASITPDWITTPDDTSDYVLMADSEKHVHELDDDAITAATFASDVDAEFAAYILNAAIDSYGGAGTYGEYIEDIFDDTGELRTNQGAWATATSVNLEDNAITAAKVHANAWQELIELLFDFDATATYATADAGSLVKQIAGNSTATIPPRLE